MTLKGKIFLISITVFITIGVIMQIHDDNVCEPKFDVIKENLQYIRNANTVKRIELYNATKGGNYLINKRIIIEDTSVIEIIRNMIISSQKGEWNHPAEAWRINIRLTLDDNKSVDLLISKIDNDIEKDMTHIGLYVSGCDDETPYPRCNLVLGKYLEKLTNIDKNK